MCSLYLCLRCARIWHRIFLHPGWVSLILFSNRHPHLPLCVGGGGGEIKIERGGLLTWLEWLFSSCAIICGGALRAALQHHTCGKDMATTVGGVNCHIVTNRNTHLYIFSLESTCSKEMVADCLTTSKSLWIFVNPEDYFKGSGDTVSLHQLYFNNTNYTVYKTVKCNMYKQYSPKMLPLNQP